MVATTDEINLQRLLINCENKLKHEQVDLWTGSEKRKYASYVNYLQFLQNRVQKTTKQSVYDYRIQALTEAVLHHQMQGDVEKGTTEARLTKKKYLDHLQQLYTPDPVWLSTLKQQSEDDTGNKDQGDNHIKSDDELMSRIMDDSDQSEDNVLHEETAKDEDAMTTTTTTTKDQGKDDTDAQLRKRNTRNPHMTREEETSNIEHVLQHHRQMHDEMTTDLGKMAHQLKLNSQSFGDILHKDDTLIRDAQKMVENNLGKMHTERQRLDKHYSKSWGTSFMNLGVVLFVCVMFVFVFFTIKFLPKA
ncbi:unnamed protein product [Absidia cylindrospora]